MASDKISPTVTPECGVIMPISATDQFSEAHWADVQSLLHRSIEKAGFIPKNVWENSVTDRISERVIGNIFAFPIVIADVSDLNPNVMFELGLRLASKKPTVVVQNEGGRKAFDISDFHTMHYPSDLNILKMEKFLDELGDIIKIKYDAFNSNNYVPFLGHVIVDVLTPDQREVPLNDLILRRLSDIDKNLSLLNPEKRSINKRGPNDVVISSLSNDKYNYFFRVPEDNFHELSKDLINNGAIYVKKVSEDGSSCVGHALFDPQVVAEYADDDPSVLDNLVSANGGRRGATRSMVESIMRG